MVEAMGVEPAPPQNANWLMARDFRRNWLLIRCLVVNSLCFHEKAISCQADVAASPHP
jgi:hypothetical protein